MKHSAVCVGLFVLVSSSAFSQAAAKKPSFEVADIQASKSTNPNPGKGSFLPTGRVDLPNVTMKQMIMASYSVQENMITGAPKWFDTDRFDVVAKAAPNTPIPTLLVMFQSLLEERFKLVLHREEKMMPGYALVRGKKALKLTESAGTENGRPDCKWQPADAGRTQRVCRNISIAELVRQLPGLGAARIDAPVIDETGLKGNYDLVLEMGAPGRSEKGAAAPDLAEFTVFDGFEQIGLRLESRKMPLKVIAIDHVERTPTDN